MASTLVKSIILHRKQFKFAIDEFMYMKKRQSEELLKKTEIICNWEIQKILLMSDQCTEITY